jgi:oligogalacturonide lyase
MNLRLVAIALVLSLAALQSQEKRDWIDADTGHRIVRLTDDAGGSTLYFHDNAFSPEGDKLMFNTPNGIAVVDVAKIGTANAVPEIVGHGRGGYFARRSRDIYFTSAGSPWR